MGDWAVVVHGTGAHHNSDYPKDADRMAQRFVDDLIAAGHTVRLATFTSGGETRLDTVDNKFAGYAPSQSIPQKALDQRQAVEVAALEAIGLAPSPRREPLPEGSPTQRLAEHGY